MPALAVASPWKFNLHPDVWLVMTAIAVGYWWALARYGPRRLGPGVAVASRSNIRCFVLGLGVLWIFSEYPIHDISEHYLFSVHMTQHLVFTTIAAPLLLMGCPSWLMRALVVEHLRLYRVVGFVTRPVMAMIIFNSFLVLTHWPAVTNETTHNELFHFGVHAVMFATALCLWFPMVNQLPELPRLTYPQRLVYVFLQSFVPTVPASFLTFSSGIVYKAYATSPRALGVDPITDQQVAGLVMKLAGGMILWGIALYTFFKWVSVEHRADREGRLHEIGDLRQEVANLPESLTWAAVERELERTAPPAP